MVCIRIDEDGGIGFELVALNGNDPGALGRLEDYEPPDLSVKARRLLLRVEFKLSPLPGP